MPKNNANLPKSERDLEFRKTIIVALITAVTSVIVATIPAYLAGLQQGKGSAPVGSDKNPAYQNEVSNKENVIRGKEDQLLILGKTLDVLMGKVDKYEEQLTIPQSRIILYEHIGYKGHGCYIRLADNAADLRSYGCGNVVSSIKVEGNIKGKAYSEINYSSSPTLEIQQNMPFLDYHWNDRILSIIVEQREQN